MVSKARLDFPEPESPVMTIRLSRGRSTATPFRLCSRAPRTEIWVRLMGGVCSRFVLDAQVVVRFSETCDAGVRPPSLRRSRCLFFAAFPPLATNVISTHRPSAILPYSPHGPSFDLAFLLISRLFSLP